MDTTERLVPANVEAEEAVLGSILIDPDAIIKIAPTLRPDDFYLEKHRWTYQAALELHERRQPVDFVTLCDEMERRGQLQEVGGAAYITELVNAVPTAIHVEHYAGIVERTATLRRLISAAGQIAQLAYGDTGEIDEVVDQAEEIIFGVSERRIQRTIAPIRQVMAEVVKRIDYLASHQGELMGVPSGFRLLDKLLGGFQKSDLIILAARPSGGKTSLALNIAVSAAKRYGQRVAFFSLEMSAEQLVQRLLAAETGINQQRLRLGQVNEDEWPLLMEAAGVLSSTSMFIDDTPALSAMELRTKARRVHAEFGLDLIVVDYLQLMRGDTRSENRVQEVSYISRSLKGLARELNVPVLALSQLSRAVESRQDKRPMLSDLRESGCLTGDVLVTLADSGRNVPIRDLEGKSDFNVWALDLQTLKLERTPVSRAFTTGIKPVYRLKTRLGRTVRATAHHCFLTIQGWKRLDELKTGDFIALPRRLDSPAKQTMSNAEMALLGHLLGDGCTLPRHVIQYTTREKDLAETVASLAREVFGKEVNPRIAHGSIQLIKGKRVRPIIYYATSSLRLAHDVQALLLRLSINAILSQHAQNGKGRDQHHVTVTGKSDLERFAERIGAVGQYQMHKAIDTAYCGTALYKQNVSRERAARVAKVVQSAELAAMAESDIYWDSIISIEPDGVEQVFDLTVPGYHNFVANNIIVHNSLEQDADIVMFIYREDMYDEGTDRQNIADIIIAKHRNGPTGIVSLYFKKELTQFMELELHREELNVPEFE